MFSDSFFLFDCEGDGFLIFLLELIFLECFFGFCVFEVFLMFVIIFFLQVCGSEAVAPGLKVQRSNISDVAIGNHGGSAVTGLSFGSEWISAVFQVCVPFSICVCSWVR